MNDDFNLKKILIMNIKKSWFYDLSLVTDREVIISNWIEVDIFDTNLDRDIYIKWNSVLNYYIFLKSEKKPKINFYQNEDSSKLHISLLVVADSKICVSLLSAINWKKCVSNVKILSIIWKKWFVDIDWIIKINQCGEETIANLEETNIFIWEDGLVNASPKLLVENNNSQAKHSCKIFNIREYNLFYLESRWLTKKQATKLVLDSFAISIFGNYSNLIWDIDKGLF